ncbi:GHKL domain-containing protein [bacterium]|nr:MAG: GHKL domain-containing protein [bacterium]
MKKQFIFISLSFAFFGAALFAQKKDYLIERISIEQGLSQSVVNTIYQDKKGFLWFGTQDGLNRFDGYSFVVFKNEPGNVNSISNNTVQALYEDVAGNLWIGTLGGLNKLSNRKITTYLNRASDPNSLSNDIITSICGDSAGNIWIGTQDDGLNMFDPKTEKFKSYKYDITKSTGLPNNSVRSVLVDRYQTLWVGTGDGLSKMDLAGGPKEEFVTYKNKPGDAGTLSYNGILSLFEDREGQIWIGTVRGGLNKLDREKNTFKSYKNDPKDPYSLSQNNVISITQDKNGDVWAGTFGGGVNVLREGKFTRYKHNPKLPSSLSNDEILFVYCDRAGTCWIGTSGGGLNKFKENKFTVYRSIPESANSLTGNDVWAMFEDSHENLWIGLYGGGLNVYRKDFLSSYRHDPNNSGSLSSNTVYALLEDHAGNIWIGTETGLSKYEKRISGRRNTGFLNFKNDPNNKTSLSNDQLTCLYQDRTGDLWVGTFGGGINRISSKEIDKPRPVFERLTNDSTHSSISDDYVNVVVEDKKGLIWVGTQNGLNEYNGKDFTVYRHVADNPNSLSHNTILSMYVDSANTLWIGTHGGGLNKFKDGIFTAYTQKDGLANNVVYGILEDAEGNLWLSTNRGLSRFNPKKTGHDAFRNYDTQDGLPSNEFNQGSYFGNKKGRVFFGGINGMVSFDPGELIESDYTPPVYLTAFRKFDKEIDFGTDISSLKNIEISYKDNFFGFEFVALDHRTPGKIHYAYKLVGFDEDWIYSNERRYATYTNLDGGHYVFKVKATSSDGIWNEKPAEITLIITPPFWKTLWFQFSSGFLLLIAAYSFYQSRLRSIKTQNIVLENKVAQRTREIDEKNKILDQQNKELEHKNDQIEKQQAQMVQAEKLSSLGRLVSGVAHEMNNPLNFTYGNAANLDIDFKEVRAIMQAGVDEHKMDPGVAHQINEHMDEMQDMIRAIKIGTERIKDIVVGLRDFSTSDGSAATEVDIALNLEYMLSLLRSRDRRNITILKNFTYVPKIKGFPSHLNQALLQIMINAIEAIERRNYDGSEGCVKISCYAEKPNVVISVQDNGVGIPNEIKNKIFDPFFTTKEVGKGTGLGLSICYGIIQSHKGKITFDTEVGRGTEFKIYLPISD